MVDVLPTIAGLAGISYQNTTMGRDLVRQEEIDQGRSNAAFIVDPLDEKSIAAGLQKMLSDSDLRTSYAMKGLKRASHYSWETTADLFLKGL